MNCKYLEIINGWNNKMIRKLFENEENHKFGSFALGIGVSVRHSISAKEFDWTFSLALDFRKVN